MEMAVSFSTMVLLTLSVLMLSLTQSAAPTGGKEEERTMPKRPVIVIDNDEPGFSTTGENWNSSTRDPGFYGKGYLWHAKGNGEAKATWKTALTKPGGYNVYARWVMSKPTDRAQNAPFIIKTSDGDVVVRVDMAQPQSAADKSPWNLLGVFPFQKEAEIVLSNDADNSVVADAVRIQYMEPIGAPTPERGQLLLQDDYDTMDKWFIEGSQGSAEIRSGTLHVMSTSMRKGVHAWFRPDLPDNVRIEYDMTVHGPKGFALVFFSAHGAKGKDILADLPPRDGIFSEYVNNPDLLCYHLSVHRQGGTVWVQGANLNKNPGKKLVQRNAVDPCPPSEGDQTYHITLIKMERRIQLFVGQRLVLFYIDEEPEFHSGGKFGFRQIYESSISYDNLRVYEVDL